MTPARRFLLLLVLPLAGCGPKPVPVPPPTGSAVAPDDASRLQGLWTAVALRRAEGQPDEDAHGRTIRFDGTAFHTTSGTQGEAEHGVFRLDPAATPKHIDLESQEGGARELLRGIYILDGDRLTLCVPDGNDAPRPTEMKASRAEGAATTVVVFTRAK